MRGGRFPPFLIKERPKSHKVYSKALGVSLAAVKTRLVPRKPRHLTRWRGFLRFCAGLPAIPGNSLGGISRAGLPRWADHAGNPWQ